MHSVAFFSNNNMTICYAITYVLLPPFLCSIDVRNPLSLAEQRRPALRIGFVRLLTEAVAFPYEAAELLR